MRHKESGQAGRFHILGKTVTLFALLVAFAAAWVAAADKETVETIYSRFIYPEIVRILSGITSLVRFSIAELFVYLVALLVIVKILRSIAQFIRERGAWSKICVVISLLLTAAVTCAALACLFFFLWGANYYRLPLSETAGINVGAESVDTVEATAKLLAERVDVLRMYVREDDDGVMALSVPMRNTIDRAKDGFRITAIEFPALGTIEPTIPKPVLSSVFMSYAGITGIYFPITAEANLNTGIIAPEIPFTMCHELAHQSGFAREDEANFIAYLTCDSSPYEDFRYSGNLMALTHLFNALGARNPDALADIRSGLSPETDRDLKAMNKYWSAYAGPVTEISESINDTYLKANRQTDGVSSYGRMVDLLIAYLKSREQGT